MQKIALITWVNWQDWAYLSDFLLKKWYKVFWVIKSQSSNIDTIKYFNNQDLINFEICDLNNKNQLSKLIRLISPDEIYNLWWLTSPWESWNYIDDYVDVNINSILWIIDWIKESSKVIKLFQASTSEMFWISNNEWLQTEETPFHPTNPYAVTKLFWYWMTNIFKKSHNLFIINWILFNHESPIRNIKFVTRKMSDWIAKIHLGLWNEIILWNLDSKRDWWFAWDFVEWFWLSLQKDTPDNYIFSTWEIHTIADFLEIWFSFIWIKDWMKYIKIDDRFNRPINLPSLYWKNNKAKNLLWWESKIKFNELVEMMVKEDINRLTTDSDY